MKRNRVILSVALALVLLAVLYVGGYPALFPKSIVEQLKSKGISVPLDGFTVKSFETRKASGLSVTDMESENGNSLFRLELTAGMQEKLAELYLEEKKVGIESLFIAQPAHYPGLVTREVDCPAEFQPEKGTIGDMTYYLMYAGERFSFGVCTQDLVKYRSAVGLLYCKDKKTFVETKLFFPADSFNKDRALEVLGSVQCL